jgi:hypothetical protein
MRCWHLLGLSLPFLPRRRHLVVVVLKMVLLHFNLVNRKKIRELKKKTYLCNVGISWASLFYLVVVVSSSFAKMVLLHFNLVSKQGKDKRIEKKLTYAMLASLGPLFTLSTSSSSSRHCHCREDGVATF